MISLFFYKIIFLRILTEYAIEEDTFKDPQMINEKSSSRRPKVVSLNETTNPRKKRRIGLKYSSDLIDSKTPIKSTIFPALIRKLSKSIKPKRMKNKPDDTNAYFGFMSSLSVNLL